MTDIFPYNIIDRYYPVDNTLKNILVTHSRQVREHALSVDRRHPELHLDTQLLSDGALLHDIGIFLTHAPSIGCHGDYPYLMHGYLGACMLRKEGLESLARICERHTGTGLTKDSIQKAGIPIPINDYLPETLEEQVICYADKFYSKSHINQSRTPEQTAQSLAKWGQQCVRRFLEWHEIFG